MNTEEITALSKEIDKKKLILQKALEQRRKVDDIRQEIKSLDKHGDKQNVTRIEISLRYGENFSLFRFNELEMDMIVSNIQMILNSILKREEKRMDEINISPVELPKQINDFDDL